MEEIKVGRYFVCSNDGTCSVIKFSMGEAERTKSEYIDVFNGGGDLIKSYRLSNKNPTQYLSL